MVTCSPLDPRFMGSNPAEVDGFLKVIKIHNTASFGRSHIIYLEYVKELSTHHKRLVKAKLDIIFGCRLPRKLPTLLLHAAALA
jgi:hypothetical protein